LHRFRFHPWHLATGLVLVCVVILGVTYWLQFNSGTSAGELAGFLPEENATLLYIDVASLRAGGFLDLFSGSPAARDPDYQQFVSRTQFDYTTDLDALAASFRGRERFLVLRGRFNWQALISYVNRQGGSCGKSFCQLEGSVPDRRISFYPLRRDLMALAVSPDPLAAYQIRKGAQAALAMFPREPAWLIIPSTALQGTDAVPERARPFVEALRGAQQIEFTVSAVQKDLRLSASIRCDSPASASQIAMEMVSAQASLRDLMLRQHLQPGPADLAGILLNGSIRDEGKRVVGRWPVPHEFLAAVASATPSESVDPMNTPSR
jgi:hypothetical protein